MAAQPLTFSQLVLTYGPLLLAALATTMILTPLCRRAALAWNIVDRPDDWLKPHKRPVPYLGGVAILLGWAVALGLAVRGSREQAAGDALGLDTFQILGVITAGALIMGLGLIDDLRLTAPTTRLLGTVLIGMVLMFCGIGDRSIAALVGPVKDAAAGRPGWLIPVLSAPLTLLVVVGACNTTNLLDGLDGLCAGVLALAFAGFFLLEVVAGATRVPVDPHRAAISLAMLGASLGFLRYNRHPATIFMGDAGSMLLGLNAAVLILLFAESGAVQTALGAVIVFGLPIADMCLTLVRRRRSGRPLMQGDRSHFYDQLVDRGYSIRRVARLSYALGAAYAGLGCAIGAMPPAYAMIMFLLVGASTGGAIWLARLVRIDSRIVRGEG